jgi:uncharacterized caspase-like protein
LAWPAPAQAKRVALLVAVGQYPGLPGSAQLEGPAFDAQAMRTVLIQRWGFQDTDVQLLLDAQATKAGILSALGRLRERTSPGDEVVIYFSGHGTSALDSAAAQLQVPVPHGSGAFVAHDFRLDTVGRADGLVIGRTDLQPVFIALEAAGRSLWFITDSCYSANQVRSVRFDGQAELPRRTIPLVSRDDRAAQAAELNAVAVTARRPPPYPYKTVVSLSAAAEGETARDISGRFLKTAPTIDGKPHGTMTDALLRVLSGQIPGDLDNDGVMTLNEVHRAVSDFMAGRAYGHTPQRTPAIAEDANGLGSRPVLSARGIAVAPRQPAVEPLRLREEQLPATLKLSLSAIPGVTLAAPTGDKDVIVSAERGLFLVRAASGDLLAEIPEKDSATLTQQIRQLSWAKQFRQLAERHRRGALPMEVDPGQQGGNFLFGSQVAFVVRPDRAGTLVLLNVSADGKISVLYPNSAREAEPLPAGQATFVPGAGRFERIRVQEPEGMDLQFALVFDEPPPGLEKLYRAQGVSPEDARLLVLESGLAAASGRFSFATSSLRAIKPKR